LGLLQAGKFDPRTCRDLISDLVFRFIGVAGNEFHPTNVECVVDAITAFSDRSSPLSDRFSVVTSFLPWLSAIAFPRFRMILVASICYIEDFISAHKTRPKLFLSLFSPFLLSDLDDPFIDETLDFFVSAEPDVSFGGLLYLLASFADPIACGSDVGVLQLVSLLLTGLTDSDPTVQSAAAFAISEVAQHFAHSPGEIAYESKIYTALVTILTGSDSGAAKTAWRAFPPNF
jgi:hypothetical protein